jgi:nicotinamide-nucleotide amidase
MQAEIITIGDEILIGQIVDTNSAFIGKAFNKIGVEIAQITSIKDDKQHILDSLSSAEKRADIIIITGGLGPTKDDITKHTLCEYFDDTLVQDDAVLAHVQMLFDKYIKAPMSPLNKLQAMMPSKAKVLTNNYGTAPGMWLEKENKVFISLPGVPFEMKALIKEQVIPKIQKKFKRPYILHKTVLTYGMGESSIAEKLEAWENNLPSHVKLAYLPNLGKVRLRLSTKGPDKEQLEKDIDALVQSMQEIIGDIIVGFEEDETIELIIAKRLIALKATLAVAESCTGGKIAQQITANAGASSYFKGGVVSYATDTKIAVLAVPEELVKQHSVVSAEVAEAMAVGVRNLLKSDYAIATTGNAGPKKGDAEAEIGTVYIAIATPSKVFSQKLMLGNNRNRVVQKAVNKAFEMILEEISKN